MQHPFINNLSDKSLEDLQTSITDLMKKLNFAYSKQNGPMIHQISMVLESYKAEHNKKMDEIMKKQNIQTTVSVEKESKK
jgi:hypothetical protein